MSKTTPKSNIEYPSSGNLIEVIKIDSLNDLKNTLGIESLEGIEEQFKKPLLTSKKELLKIKEEITVNETSGKIREFLENKGVIGSVGEQFKRAGDAFKENFKQKEKSEKYNGSLEKISDNLINEYDKVGNNETIKKSTEKTKEVLKKGKSALAMAKIFELAQKWEKSDNWFLQILGGILGFVGSLMGYDKIKEKGEKAKEIINPTTVEYKETLNQTQNTIIKSIETIPGVKLSEKNKKYLKTMLSPNIEGSYLNTQDFKELMEKVKNGEQLTLKDFKKYGILEKIYTDPKLKEVLSGILKTTREQLYKKLKGSLNKSGIQITEGDNNDSKLKEIIERKVSDSSLKKFVESGEGSFIDIANIGIETATFIPGIIWELWKEDIIDTSNLFIGLAEKGGDKIKIGLKGLAGVDIIPDLIGEITFGQLEEKIGDLDNEKKVVLLRAFYAELGLIGAVLGTTAYYGSSMLVTLAEKSTSIDGKSLKQGHLKNAFKGINQPPVDKLKSILEKLAPGEGLWLDDIKKSLKLTQESYEVLEELKNAPESAKAGLLEKLENIEKKVNKIKGENGLGYKKGKTLNNTKNALKHPMKYFYFDKTINDIDSIVKSNKALGQSVINGTFGKTLDKIKQFKNTFKIRYIGGHSVLHLTDNLQAKEFGKALGKLTPEITKTFLGRLPVILVGTSIYNEVVNGDGDLADALLATNGFVGGFMLMDQARVNIQNGQFTMTDAAVGGLGLFVIGSESFLVGKDLVKYVGKGQFIRAIPMAAFNSVVRLPIEAVKLGGWGVARGAEIFKIAKGLFKSSSKRGGWITVGSLVGLAVIVGAEKLFSEDMSAEELEKNGLFKDGEPNIDFLKQKWSSLEKEKQEEILSISTITLLPKDLQNKPDEFKLQLENGVFIIQCDNEILNKNKANFDNIKKELSMFLFSINSNIIVNIKSSV